jgi:signal transduction histidine kinase
MSTIAARVPRRSLLRFPTLSLWKRADGEQDPLLAYATQKVRIGVNATLLILAVVGTVVFVFRPNVDEIPTAQSVSLLLAAVLGVATVTVVPWERLIGTRIGTWYMHGWGVLDIVFIALAITVHGGPSSELFYLYGLTTTLFAITHSPRIQAAYLGITAALYMAVVWVDGWHVAASTVALRLALLTALALMANFVSRELRRLLDAQHDVTRRLQELDDLRSDFLSTVQHELRTPLAAIKGFASTLTNHWERMHDEMRGDLLGRIGTNAGELDALISQLLDFSMADRGYLRIEPTACDVGSVVSEAIDRVDGVLAGHEVNVAVPQDLIALADPACCFRILENLLSNAARFSEAGTRINVWARETQGRVLVAVQDEGIGVPAGEAQRIFERFYRIDRGESSSNGGTGIGLAVVRQLVEAQGGEVWVESADGGGSTFLFTLPLKAVRSGSKKLSLANLEAGTATLDSIRLTGPLA